ncbi:hypothetical protein BG261_05245 [Floricoccus tropicus]|uniref:EAL domain-containing protein n=1 Tax=Floricoccus tropicus TaxID=1859473 RepID=A0A1E8GKL4_9LACT|nr:EAL domain-containing protein [Floricoccus tropicus]OFI48795.1 hypothetical protein BG261_05245 [Floricoccus tropicus]
MEKNRIEEIQNLSLAFQPIVDLNSETKYLEFEILLRNKKDNSFPAELFNDLLMDDHVYSEFLKWFKQELIIQINNHPDYRFSINFFPVQLNFESTWSFFEDMSQYSSNIIIEITEHPEPFRDHFDIEDNQAEFVSNIEKIAAFGYDISLDDISCGQYSLEFVLRNIENIRNLKFTLLPFKNHEFDDIDIFIAAWYDLAQRHNKRFIIEGIEDKELSQSMLERGLTYQQGYNWPMFKDLEQVELCGNSQ